jgi:hypothetical protein
MCDVPSWIQTHLWPGFASNFVAGVVSAIFVLVGLKVIRWLGELMTYGPMAGKYEECEMPTETPTSGTVRIKSSGSKLKTEGISKDGEVEWNGVIHMNPLNPDVGDGVYRYVGKQDCGTHHVQRDPETQDFMVMGSNTSHPEGKERFNLLWRRKKNSR